MARNAEEVIAHYRGAMVLDEGDLFISKEDLALVILHVDWLRREFALVQEQRNDDLLQHSLYLNRLADLCTSPLIPPAEGAEWLLENRITALRRENAVLRSQLGEL